jgi:enterochelin esterase-like enzyme
LGAFRPARTRIGSSPVNRRGFALGAGACVLIGGAAAACGVAVRPSDQQRTRRRPASGTTQVSGYLDSRFTRARMGWTISTPGGGRRPLAIVYCLHGYHNDHRMAFDQIDVPEVAASVGLRVVVAAVDGGADSYWHRRADGTDALAMLLREFVPMVRARVGPLPQALIGWSMGGYGALLAAERAAGRFLAVAPASPALWLAPGATAPGAFDSPGDFYANDVFTGVDRLRAMSVAVFCGTGDPFYLATRHLASLMDFPHEARFAPGGHDDAYWLSVAPAQLRAIGAAPGIAR